MVRCAKKNNFQFLLLFAIKMAVLNVILERKGLGPLGVKGYKMHNDNQFATS